MSHAPTLTLTASDPDELARFYAALGFTEVSRAQGGVELDLGGLRLSIISGSPTGHPRRSDPPHGFELTVRADDPASVRTALVAAGGVVRDARRSGGTGTLILDPDGNPVRVLATAAPTAAGPPTSVGAAAGMTTGVEAAGTAAPTAPPGPQRSGEPGADGQRTSAVERPTTPTEQRPGTPGPGAATDDSALPRSPLPETYYSEHGVPTFDAVAERIQQQSATADGNAVLDAESTRGKDEADTMDRLKKAGKDRLDQLRKSMGL